ncbi:MAG: hypothetical protein Q9222_005002 [Ikaeria aurantiellina]
MADTTVVPSSSSLRCHLEFKGLPNEVLEEIVFHALTSSYPILNASLDPRKTWPTIQHFLDLGQRNGLRDINVAILTTCKLFHKMGILPLYTQNTFLYAANTHPNFSRGLNHVVCESSSNIRSRITHLMIRTDFFPIGIDSISNHAFEAAKFVTGFPNLRTLQLDFCAMHEPKSEEDYWPFTRRRITDVRKDIWDYQKALTSYLTDPLRLQQLTITGLPYDKELIIIAILFSQFVDVEGIIGLGYGVEGRRYYRNPEWVSVAAPDIRYRQKQDLVGWDLGESDRDSLVIPPFNLSQNLRIPRIQTP